MPNEKLFQRELADAFRTNGWWVWKIPDQPISRMETAGDGKLRFSTPKPCDLVLCSPTGAFSAIECKLLHTSRGKIDARWMRQCDTLRGIATRPNSYCAFALNFRYRGERKGVCNRAFLLRVRGAGDALAEWRESLVIDLPWVIPRAQELTRKAGGWILPLGLE